MAGTYELKIEGLAALMAAFEQYPEIAEPRLQKAIEGSQAILASKKDGNVPMVTGNLINRWTFRASRLYAQYFPTVKYAIWVNDGTDPHDIVAKNGGALAIPLTGGTYMGVSKGSRTVKIHTGKGRSRAAKAGTDFIFRHSVHHPGSKAREFMQKMVAAAQPEVNALFEKALDLIVQDIAASTQ